jgi:hypothetical protein
MTSTSDAIDVVAQLATIRKQLITESNALDSAIDTILHPYTYTYQSERLNLIRKHFKNALPSMEDMKKRTQNFTDEADEFDRFKVSRLERDVTQTLNIVRVAAKHVGATSLQRLGPGLDGLRWEPKLVMVTSKRRAQE